MQSPAKTSSRPFLANTFISSADKDSLACGATLLVRNAPNSTAMHSTITSRMMIKIVFRKRWLFMMFSPLVNDTARGVQCHLAYGFVIAHVSGTTTNMNVERILDGCLQVLFFDRFAFELVNEYGGTCHKARGAIAALERKKIHKGFLHWAELFYLALLVEFGVAFNGNDLATIKHMSAVNTGATFFLSTVFLHLNNGASMTDPLAAPKPGPSEVEIVV